MLSMCVVPDDLFIFAVEIRVLIFYTLPAFRELPGIDIVIRKLRGDF